MVEEARSLSGLTDGEAREFHRLFMMSFIVFTLVAIVAHFLAWQWRPWLPPEGGYKTASIIETAREMASYLPYAYIA